MPEVTKEPSSDDIKNFQDAYIDISYRWGGANGGETIDILADYPWIADRTIGAAYQTALSIDTVGGVEDTNSAHKIPKRNNLPFCYVIERKSAANAGIANLFNMIKHMEKTLEKAARLGDNIIKTVTDIFGNKKENLNNQTNNSSNDSNLTLGGLVNGAATKIKDALKTVLPDDGMKKLLENNNLNDDILVPYRYLYITKPTNKNYVFPLATEGASFNTIKNSWGKPNGLPFKLINNAVSMLESAVGTVSEIVNFGNNALSFAKGEASDISSDIQENAKSYTYPTNGDSVKVDFVLYNTTKKDAWKTNYRFLFLFFLRNLPLRIDATSFVPPLLYEVIVPGVKRLPVCSVDSIIITPKGMMRTLTCDNFISGSGSLTVNVPEAWNVSIVFQSLIGPSANLMLSGLYGKVPITSVSAAEVPVITNNNENNTPPPVNDAPIPDPIVK